MMNFNDWEILKNLRENFLDTVEMAYVFGNNGDNALLSTSDGRVYGLGQNSHGCLASGDSSSYSLPSEMTLSKTGMKELVCGGDEKDILFLIAYFDSEEIYWWGLVPFPVNRSVICTPERLSIDTKIQVKTVACGALHCAILSVDGKVFTCGRNNVGQLGHEAFSKQEIEKQEWDGRNFKMVKKVFLGASTLGRVTGIIEDQIVVDVSCGYDFSVVLLDNGKVAAWGNNDGGQLGINKSGHFSRFPVEVVSLSMYYEAVIEKMVCGKRHVLALNERGALYVWGSGISTQVEVSNAPQRQMGCPMEVKVDNLRFTDIGASYLCDISVAQCENRKVYFWGETTKNNVFKLTEAIRCESINDIFVYLSKPKVMVRPLRRLEGFNPAIEQKIIAQSQEDSLPYFAHHLSPFFEKMGFLQKSNLQPYTHQLTRAQNSRHQFSKLEGTEELTLLETLQNEFNNPDSSDLTIVVDNKEIHVHQNILKMRSKYFNVLITRWLEENSRVLEIKEKSFSAIETYLRYLYTDYLEADLNLAVELLQLADEYGDNKLKSLCQNIILRDMKTDGVADVFASTRNIENCKLLNKFSLEFALRHAREVINSPGFDMLDADSTKDLFREYVKIKGNCL